MGNEAKTLITTNNVPAALDQTVVVDQSNLSSLPDEGGRVLSLDEIHEVFRKHSVGIAVGEGVSKSDSACVGVAMRSLMNAGLPPSLALEQLAERQRCTLIRQEGTAGFNNLEGKVEEVATSVTEGIEMGWRRVAAGEEPDYASLYGGLFAKVVGVDKLNIDLNTPTVVSEKMGLQVIENDLTLSNPTDNDRFELAVAMEGRLNQIGEEPVSQLAEPDAANAEMITESVMPQPSTGGEYKGEPVSAIVDYDWASMGKFDLSSN